MPSPVTVRVATEADLPRIVELIHRGAWDGSSSENPSLPLAQSYYDAFRAVTASPAGRVFVAESDGVVVGTVQYTVIPNLSHQGQPVAQLDSLHVDETRRSQGIGEAIVRHCIALATEAGCFRIQLTSNKARADAHRFYYRLGFKASHEGMKLSL